MPIIDTVATGQNIKNYIKENNIKIKEIQEIFGFGTPQAIYKWMRGDAMPTIDNIVILANILGVKIDDLVATNTIK